MGATNNIKGIILKAWVCHSCSCSFTETDIQESNWTIEYRTNHATDWTANWERVNCYWDCFVSWGLPRE